MPTFLVVKTVTPRNEAFDGAAATFSGSSCAPTAEKGVLEISLPSGVTGGEIQATASVGSVTWSASQKIRVDLTTSPPTVAFDGRQSIYALRVAVTTRGSDFNLEVHFVVDAAIRVAMDDFFASFSGPYQVNGAPVTASAQFRMNGGFTADAAHVSQRALILKQAGVAGSAQIQSEIGRPSASQLRAVAQALVSYVASHGGLTFTSNVSKTNVATFSLATTDGLRKMMFDYGVGIDCAGYVQQVFLATRGKGRPSYGLNSDVNNENLGGLRRNKRFRSLDSKRARAGDMIILDPPPDEDVGHTVIVYSHVVEDTDVILAQNWPAAQALSEGTGTGPAHLYYVDASWGADEFGDPDGGVQRDPWTYNENTGKWGWLDGTTAKFQSFHPYGHPYVGTFRPRDEV